MSDGPNCVVILDPRGSPLDHESDGRNTTCSSRNIEVCTHPKLRRQVFRVRLVHLLPAREHVLQLVVIHLVNPFLERVGGFVLVRLECGEVLGNFVVTLRAGRSGVSEGLSHSTTTTLRHYRSPTLPLSPFRYLVPLVPSSARVRRVGLVGL
jgi:hypothetical protein